MAGDWMKIELELPDKPEVHAMAGMLCIDPDCVVGKLIRVWQWFDKHTTDGNAYGVTYLLPDRISGVSGFGEAMSFVGWLEQHDKTLHMPKFDRHTSESAKARALTAKRVANHKAKTNAKGNGDSVTYTVSEALPREEKRREDIKEVNTLVVSKLTPCPQQEILDLYAKHLSGLPQVRVWEGARAKNLQARWKWVIDDLAKKGGNSDKSAGLDFFARMFEYINGSDFLMGRNGAWTGCNLGWIVKAENFAKIIEGQYENKEAA